jgi:hypothetical protein
MRPLSLRKRNGRSEKNSLTEQFKNISFDAINSNITFVQKALQMTSKTNTGRVLINPVTNGYRSAIFAEQIM